MSEKVSIFEKPILSTKIKSANVKIKEAFFGYLLGPIGALLGSGVFTSFLNRYYTDVLFKDNLADPALSQSVSTFLTLLPMLSAILIVICNLLVGQLIEKTKTKAGKARPWILLSSVLITAASIFMFVFPPQTDPILKMVMTAISYNLYYSVAYPLYNTSNSTLIPVSTRNSKQRGLLASAANIAGLAVMGFGSMIFPTLAGFIITTSTAWLVAFIIIGALSGICCIIQYFFTRERVTEESINLKVEKKSVPIKQQLKAVTTDGYWWLIIIFYLIFQFSGAIKNLSMVEFCNNSINLSFWGDKLAPSEAAGMTQTLLAVLGAIPMAVASVLVWPLSNKFGKKNVTIVGMIIGVIGGVIAWIGGKNIVPVAIGVALKCLGSSPACYMILAMISDVSDHIEAKKGFRCDGLTMSIYSSIMVAATPIAQSLFNLITNSAQNKEAFPACYVWIETIAYAVCGVMMIFFTVEKKLPNDQKTILEHQKAEALALGVEWIEPQVRLQMEQEQAEKEAEQARILELHAKCEKKGLSFDEEEGKYQEKLAQKNAKKEASEKAKAEKASAKKHKDESPKESLDNSSDESKDNKVE